MNGLSIKGVCRGGRVSQLWTRGGMGLSLMWMYISEFGSSFSIDYLKNSCIWFSRELRRLMPSGTREECFKTDHFYRCLNIVSLEEPSYFDYLTI